MALKFDLQRLVSYGDHLYKLMINRGGRHTIYGGGPEMCSSLLIREDIRSQCFNMTIF